jgi:hypothetical protein
MVRRRGDINDSFAGTSNETRPFSMLPLPGVDSAIFKPLPQCQNVTEFLQSIKLGTRKWEDEHDNNYNHSNPLERERCPSQFVPATCYVPFIPPSPERTCGIMNHFSHVIIDGDSLSHHL